MAGHAKLLAIINEFLTAKIPIEIIALQEIWQTPYPELVVLPGFNFVYNKRVAVLSRGGGVGFYIHENLKYQTLNELSIFNKKLFETLTVKIISKKKQICDIKHIGTTLQHLYLVPPFLCTQIIF